MNFAKLILSCTFIGLLMSLAGCAKKSSYKPRNIQSLKESAHVDYQETKELVTVRAKAFTNFDCDYIFGERADRITEGENRLQPVQLSIENNSPSVVKLRDSDIDLSLVPTKEVADRLSGFNYQTAGIYCGIGTLVIAAATGLSWLVLPAVLTGLDAILAPLLLSTLVFAPVGSFLLLATPCMFLINTFNYEKKELRECIAKTDVGKTIMVNPGKTIDVLLFVHKKQYKPTFACTLIDQQQNKKRQFEVRLPGQN